MKNLNDILTEAFLIKKHQDKNLNNIKLTLKDIDDFIEDNSDCFVKNDSSIYCKHCRKFVFYMDNYSIWFLIYFVCYKLNKIMRSVSTHDIEAIISKNKELNDLYKETYSWHAGVDDIMSSLAKEKDSPFIKENDKYTVVEPNKL